MSETTNDEPLPLQPPPGPGDDDPRTPARGEAATLIPPPGPGDGGDDSFTAITPPPAGPGDAPRAPRNLTRVPTRPKAEE